jgi:hypothetical protein
MPSVGSADISAQSASHESWGSSGDTDPMFEPSRNSRKEPTSSSSGNFWQFGPPQSLYEEGVYTAPKLAGRLARREERSEDATVPHEWWCPGCRARSSVARELLYLARELFEVARELLYLARELFEVARAKTQPARELFDLARQLSRLARELFDLAR